MFYKELREAENQFIEQQKADCRARGFELTFESECTMRYAFSQGWQAVSTEAYNAGSRDRQTLVCHAIGAARTAEEKYA